MNPRADMSAAIGALLDGALTGEDAHAFLTDMELEKLTPDALAGAVDAVMARALPFPHFPDAVDCCGTGGDGQSTYNISTAVALVVAACGVPVAKHGNRAVSSQSGSADVLAALGVNTAVSAEHAARMLEQIGIAFLFAPSFHPGFARVAPLRKAIGKRTIFNLLGPLCNPARPQRQLLGVFAPEYNKLVAETGKLLGLRHLLVVHGADGSDEISLCGETYVTELVDGAIQEYLVTPEAVGLTAVPEEELTGGDAAYNAQALRQLLAGESSAYADAVAFNAGALLMAAGKTARVTEGVALAQTAITNGSAAQLFSSLVTMSHAHD